MQFNEFFAKSACLGAMWCVLAVISGCAAAPPIAPFENAAGTQTLTAQEKQLWTQARRFEQAIADSGQRYVNPELRAYMQQILDRLYPEFKGILRVHLLKTPVVNGFVLPNGGLYLHIGLPACLDNEAQLATILAHEAAHFVYRHGLQAQAPLPPQVAARAMAAAGLPTADTLPVAAMMLGYAPDLEAEADRASYRRLVAAGYAPAELHRTFAVLAAQARALAAAQPTFFFASHARMAARRQHYEILSARDKNRHGRVGQNAYLRLTYDLRIDCLQADLAAQRYHNIIVRMEDTSRLDRYPPYSYYYLGEAYRLRNATGDGPRAEQALRFAIEENPAFAPSYRALGFYYADLQKKPLARGYLTEYLKRAPRAGDRDAVEKRLEQLRQKK